MSFRRVLRHINPLNILLLCAIAASAFYIVPSFTGDKVYLTIPERKAATEKQEEGKTDAAQPTSVADYALIAEQNLFHPERIIPPEKKTEQLPKPEFVLYGTLITGDAKIAYLEDLKAPHTTRGRGKRQKALHLNQSLSGFTVKEIHHDRVLMARADDTIEVKIGEKKKARAAETATAPPAATEAAPAVQALPLDAPKEKPKGGGLPPGIVHTEPPPPGAPVPDERTISRVKEAFGSGIQKRPGLQR